MTAQSIEKQPRRRKKGKKKSSPAPSKVQPNVKAKPKSKPKQRTKAASTTAVTTKPTMQVLFLINLLVAFIAVASFDLFGWADGIIGFLFGLIALSIFEREYGRRGLALVSFIRYVLWQIVMSNVSLAWTILQPQARMDARLDPGIIAIPLDVTSGLEITVLASVITLTPGTLSVDLGTDDADRNVLYVHNLQVIDPDAFRTKIKTGFEQRILRISRGAGA